MNVYNELKKEIGLANVTNEFIELIYRTFCDEHQDLLSDNEKLKAFSEKHKINLTQLEQKSVDRIAGLYIINIHSLFSDFLTGFIKLPGAPTQRLKEKSSKEDMLSWVLKGVYPQGYDEEIECGYYICNYYRLMRNSLIHLGKKKRSKVENNALDAALKYFSESSYFEKYKNKLEAPHPVEELGFDDQVLFSKAAIDLATRVYFESTYDLRLHLNHHKDDVYRKVATFTDRDRIEKYLYYHFDQYYPIRDKKYHDTIEDIITDFLEQGVLA